MSFSKFARQNLGPSPLLRTMHETITNSFPVKEFQVITEHSSSLGEVENYLYTLKDSNRAFGVLSGHRLGKYDVQGVHIWENYSETADPSFSIDFGGLLTPELIEALIPVLNNPQTGNFDSELMEDFTFVEAIQAGHVKDAAKDTWTLAKMYAKRKAKDIMHPGQRTKLGIRVTPETEKHNVAARYALKNPHKIEKVVVNHEKNQFEIHHKPEKGVAQRDPDIIPHGDHPHNIQLGSNLVHTLGRKGVRHEKIGDRYIPPHERTPVKTESYQLEDVWSNLFESVAPLTRTLHIAVHPGFGTLGRIERGE